MERPNRQSKEENFIYGIRAVMEAIKSGKPIDKIFLKKGLSNDLFKELFQEIRSYDIPFQYVPGNKIDNITQRNHQGVLAFLSPVELYNVESIVPKLFEEGKNPLLLVLDKVSDVRNFGAIIRTAECAGIDAIVIPHKRTARLNEDAVKTSAGAIFQIPICRTPGMLKTLKYLKDSGIQIIAATEKSDKNYYKSDFSLPTAILMGSEETGISKEYLQEATNHVKIPLLGKIESLNVSVAAGILMFEAVRQRI
jgi:23S rRNA (guanosine2251-2'-O)-methyltransferase